MSYIVRPKKSLGQHFLIDLNIAQAIADTLDNYKNTPILEVGPGMGVLTQYLLSKGHDLTVVELDHESIEYLQRKFSRIERTHFRRRFSKTRFIEVVLWKFLRYRKLSLQYIQSNIFQSTRIQRSYTLLQRHDSKRSRRTNGCPSGQ